MKHCTRARHCIFERVFEFVVCIRRVSIWNTSTPSATVNYKNGTIQFAVFDWIEIKIAAKHSSRGSASIQQMDTITINIYTFRVNGEKLTKDSNKQQTSMSLFFMEKNLPKSTIHTTTVNATLWHGTASLVLLINLRHLHANFDQ